MRRFAKLVLVAAAMSLAHESPAATITVHEPDASGRVFVDVVGTLDIGDEKVFEKKTANRRNVIVTLVSAGGNPLPAMEMGKLIRKQAMTTYVPGNRLCASACALIWLAGKPRTLEGNSRVGFHAAYNRNTGQESGAGNALIGAYLNELGLSAKAIVSMTSAGPMEMAWLTDDRAKAWGVAVETMQPARAIPISAQPTLQANRSAPPSPTSLRPQAMRARTSTSLHLRTAPGRESDIVLAMPTNSEVTVGECRRMDDGKTWCRVSHAGTAGWVNAAFLTSAAQ